MWIQALLGGSLIYIVTALLVVSAVVSLVDFLVKPDFYQKEPVSEQGLLHNAAVSGV